MLDLLSLLYDCMVLKLRLLVTPIALEGQLLVEPLHHHTHLALELLQLHLLVPIMCQLDLELQELLSLRLLPLLLLVAVLV